MPGRKRLWGRSALVVAQVAMSLMLLTASFLMVRGFQHTLLDGMEFAKDHLLMTTFDPRLVQYDSVQTKQFFKVLKDRARDAGSRERDVDAKRADGPGRFRRGGVRAGRISDAERPAKFHVGDEYRR